MYHGTRPEVAALIEQGGFKASTHGLLGPGVYLSRDADKARKYGATVLEVLVRMGRVCRVDHHPELIPKGNGTDAPWHHVGGFDAAWVPPDCAAGIFENAKHFSGVVEEDCVWDSGRVKVLGRTVDDGDERMGLVEWCFEDGAKDGKMNMRSRRIAFSRAEAMVIESHYRAWMRARATGGLCWRATGRGTCLGCPVETDVLCTLMRWWSGACRREWSEGLSGASRSSGASRDCRRQLDALPSADEWQDLCQR